MLMVYYFYVEKILFFPFLIFVSSLAHGGIVWQHCPYSGGSPSPSRPKIGRAHV